MKYDDNIAKCLFSFNLMEPEILALYFVYMLNTGLLQLILFIILVRYRFNIYEYINMQTKGNKVKSLLFWSFLISIVLLFVYIMIFLIYVIVLELHNKKKPELILNAEFSIPVLNFFFPYILMQTVHCCMWHSNRSSTSFCIPGTYFFKYPTCSYFFQSSALYIINIIPHVVLSLVSILVLRFNSAPIPSVTVVFYFVLLLIVNVVVNAVIINLMTSVCKTKKEDYGALKKCGRFTFGCMVAISSNIITVMVVISLLDYLMNSTEEEKGFYDAIPGLLVAVFGWYFSGHITKYTGIDLSINAVNDHIIDDVENGTRYQSLEDN